jgi:hypothetical protein
MAKKDQSKSKKTHSSHSAGKKSSRGSEIHLEAICREPACENLPIGVGYCRPHYIKNWQKIKRRELILKDGRLRQYIEELILKYPDKHIEAIRLDLASDDVFLRVITELDLKEPADELVDMDSGESLDDYPLEGISADIEGRDDDY